MADTSVMGTNEFAKVLGLNPRMVPDLSKPLYQEQGLLGRQPISGTNDW